VSERFVPGVERSDYDALLQRLQAEQQRLSALPSEPDTVEIMKTGQRYSRTSGTPLTAWAGAG
jgi:chorismate synthase